MDSLSLDGQPWVIQKSNKVKGTCILSLKIKEMIYSYDWAALIRFFLFISITIFSNIRGGSRSAVTSKLELFVIIVDGFEPLTIITKCSISPRSVLNINILFSFFNSLVDIHV